MAEKKYSQDRIALFAAGGSIACMLMLFLGLSISQTNPELPAPVARKHIQHWILEDRFSVGGNMRLRYAFELEELYSKNDFQPIWLSDYDLNEAGEVLVRSLKETASDHWKAYGYRISRLDGQLKKLKNQPKKATAIDVLLTDAYIDYAMQVLNKDLLPNTGELDHPSFRHVAAPPEKKFTALDVANMLVNKINEGEPAQLIESLVPQHDGYKTLSNELMRYQAIAESGLWFPVEEGKAIELGQYDGRVPQIRWMLEAYGDISSDQFEWFFGKGSNSTDPMVAVQKYIKGSENPIYLFDDVLLEGLKRFQKRNGLPAKGTFTEETRKILNVPPYLIAQQIALNMKRYRYLPEKLGNTYVLVNMADYRLQFIKNGKEVTNMKVIIGAPNRRTPVLAETISTLVLAPEWNVPYRIAHGDVLPKAKEDPNYLKDNHFKVVEGWTIPPKYVDMDNLDWDKFNARENAYRLVQEPGKHNSLGLVKFVIPNDKSIYLHDTSHPELFAYRERAISSGCIRVERPEELARLLLEHNTEWSESRLRSTFEKAETTVVHLRKEVPVYLMYWTAWVDENNQLQIRDDVYNRDQVNVAASQYKSIIL